MQHFFLHPVLKDPAEDHALVPLHEPAHNTNEGSEFLDDAIRMEDLPIIYTEESIATGSPYNLL
jgi:hypothetical protein